MQAMINIPENVFIALNESKDEILGKMKLFSAIEYFKAGKLSLGKAAELAEMNKTDFMIFLGKQGVAVINYSEDDLENELKILDNL